MSDLLRTLLIGLVGGVAGWALSRAFLGPRLAWSTGITCTEADGPDSKPSYHIKVQNVGWFRSITQIEFTATINFFRTPHNRDSFRIKLTTNEIPRLIPGQNNVAVLDLASLTDLAKSTLRELGHEDLVDQDVPTLHALLEALPSDVRKPWVAVRALATDGWSGANAYRESMQYTIDDLYRGYTFEARLGFVAKLWIRWRRHSARLRYWMYHTRIHQRRRPSLNVKPSKAAQRSQGSS
jgi:hypothetical protein